MRTVYRFTWLRKNKAASDFTLSSDHDAREMVILSNQLGHQVIDVRRWDDRMQFFAQTEIAERSPRN